MKKIFRKILKWILRLISGVISLAFILMIIEYLNTVFYEFPEPVPFSGADFHNPYQGINEANWKKANFHAHSRAWFGLTNGNDNPPERIEEVYGALEYDVFSISDYQRVNDFLREKEFFIPGYEHGYNIKKTHQLCIGSEGATMLDYPLIQSLHHKQHIIELLAAKNQIVALAHPKFSGGYKTEDLKYLTGYQLVEVLNNYRNSEAHWDSALSAGHAVFLIADDDSHDLNKLHEAGHHFTMINAPDVSMNSIVSALKEGKAYGVELKVDDKQTLEEKQQLHQTLPFLKSLEIESDTLIISLSAQATFIQFIGQGGIIKKTAENSALAKYALQPDDTYIRIKALYGEEVGLYFNPVFRKGATDPFEGFPSRNVFKTAIFRLITIPVFVALMVALIWRLFRGAGRGKSGRSSSSKKVKPSAKKKAGGKRK
ncbi:MAG: hypothetical protein KKA07_01725 [Bacteroidetes bacterium]|nr:hypothetical protein [Bacteroidota bacterium]MBU1717769.1 hypothetical protein [Bacteroidota bacterium]